MGKAGLGGHGVCTAFQVQRERRSCILTPDSELAAGRTSSLHQARSTVSGDYDPPLLGDSSLSSFIKGHEGAGAQSRTDRPHPSARTPAVAARGLYSRAVC